MYFTDALRVLARRWVILLVGALVVIGASFAIRSMVPVQYQANGQVLLVLPADATGKKTPTNPYLNLQPGLITTASIMASAVSSDDSRRALDKRGFTADYTADLLPGTGPIIVISAESADPRAAIDMRDELVKELNSQLRRLQSQVGVPERQVISSLPTSLDSEAAPLRGDRLRALIAADGALVALTLIVAFVVDASARRRREGPANRQAPTASRRRPSASPREARAEVAAEEPREPPRRRRAPAEAAADTGSAPGAEAGSETGSETEFAEEHPRPPQRSRRMKAAVPRGSRRSVEHGADRDFVPTESRDSRS